MIPLADPKHWSPREPAYLRELERLREIYLASAFRGGCRTGDVGDVQNIILAGGRVTQGQIVMIVGWLFPLIFWMIDGCRLALTKASLTEIRADWARLGKGRPWGEGLDILVLA